MNNPRYVTRKITSIHFDVFTPDEIKALSVVRITEPSLYSQSLPTPNSCSDHRQGSTDRRIRCGTCFSTVRRCPGHPGYIELHYPVFHIGFLETTLRVLRCVCFFCSALLATPSKGARDRKSKLAQAANQARLKKCCHVCGGGVPVYTRVGLQIRCDFSRVTFEDAEERKYCSRPFTAAEARTILSQVSDADYKLIGLNPEMTRPENFIVTVLMVPPPIVRPSVVVSEGSKARGQDDLTIKLCDIVKSNLALKQILDQEASTIPINGVSAVALCAIGDLTFHVTTLINNEVRGNKQSLQRSGLPSKSITSRLRGKEGRVRGHLMGKRVDFSARSVISPDPVIDLDEVGIPMQVAMQITLPEKVCASNLGILRHRISLGSKNIDGAKTIIRYDKDNEEPDITYIEFCDEKREAASLKIGDVVETFCRPGTPVVFNRQPSLHKQSMQCHRARIVSGLTFRLNVATTTPYNADFDGDEMNMHFLQDMSARVEAAELMAVHNQIVSPQSNKPAIGLVQDGLLAGYLLTSSDAPPLSRREMCELALNVKDCCRLPAPEWPSPDPGQSLWHPRQVLSLLLPSDFSYYHPSTDTYIRDGHLVSGQLCRQTLGTASHSIAHKLWLEKGARVSVMFLSNAQRVFNKWLIRRGFSVRLSDCAPSPTLKSMVSEVRDTLVRRSGVLESCKATYSLPAQTVEDAQVVMLSKALTTVGQLVSGILDPATNTLCQTVAAGSKGNLINIAQLSGIVGQQCIEGKRPEGLGSEVNERGFVGNSYYDGLNIMEYFFHSQAGREGLVDTAVKTANTGYIQRRLMKGMESLKMEYDGTARCAKGQILHFLYGADGLDATRLMKCKVDFLSLPLAVLIPLIDAEPPPISKQLHDFIEPCRRQAVRETLCIPPNHFVHCPLDVGNMVELETMRMGRERSKDSLDGICTAVMEGVVRIGEIPGGGNRDMCTLNFVWHLRPTELQRRELGAQFVRRVTDMLLEEHKKALLQPGEMIGPTAAESIGEPCTQMTLNTFHYAGVSSKNVTLGIPRVKELIDCTKNMKTPSMTLPFASHLESAPQEALEYLAVRLPRTTLGSVVESQSVVEEPEFYESSSLPDKDILEIERELNGGLVPACYSPFVIRYVLKYAPMAQRSLEPASVAEAIRSFLPEGSCVVYYSQPSMEPWIVRVRLIGEEHTHKSHMDLIWRFRRMVVLGGVEHVESATVVCDRDGPVRIETAGTMLQHCLCFAEFRKDQVISNDIVEVQNTLGIEACATLLFHELQSVISFDGTYVNERHILLLTNVMTHLGTLLPISRHGLNRLVDSGPLSRCSFEETVDVLFDAAMYGEIDPLRGVTEGVMLGQRCNIGTGIADVSCEDEAYCLHNNICIPDQEEEEIIFTAAGEDNDSASEWDGTDIEDAGSQSQLIDSTVEPPFSDRLRDGMEMPRSVTHSFLPCTGATRSRDTAYRPSSPRMPSQALHFSPCSPPET